MEHFDIRKWDLTESPTLQAIRSLLAEDGLQAYQWSNGPGDTYGEHSHDYNKVIYAVEGSIVFRLPATGDEVHLHPGDRLDLPGGTKHSAIVGSGGVTCLEAHREI